MLTWLFRKNDPLSALRSAAERDFRELPAPAFKYGLNVFFKAEDVMVPSRLPFARGLLRAAASIAPISNRALSIISLSDALRDPRFANVIRERLTWRGGDRIDSWNLAMLDDGLFVHVPVGAHVTEPVRIDAVVHGRDEARLVFVFAEEGSSVTIVEHLSSATVAADTEPQGKKRGVFASRTEIVARAGAHVSHVSVQDVDAAVTVFDRKRAEAHRDAAVSWTDCVFGTGYVRSRVSTELVGAGAALRQLGLSFATHGARHDVRHEAAHLADRTVSDICARAAVGGSKTVYRSLVRIAPGTHGAAAAQKEDTLLLDHAAEIDAMPDLEIGTNDVQARHSASAGRVDKEQLFYLMSRGMDEATARRTLIEAFFAPVVAEMRAAGMHDMVECLVAGKLEHGTYARP